MNSIFALILACMLVACTSPAPAPNKPSATPVPHHSKTVNSLKRLIPEHDR